MLEFNTALLKLQYEILNVSLEELAAQLKIPVSIVADEARRGGWRQLWPDEPTLHADIDDANCAVLPEPTLDIEQRTEMARKRLQYYQVMKDQILSAKYLALEAALLDSATELLNQGEYDAPTVQRIATVYKLLSSGTSLSDFKSSALQEAGIPLAIVRDVSGARQIEA